MLVFHLVNTTDKDMDTSFKILLYFIGLTTLWTTVNCSTTGDADIPDFRTVPSVTYDQVTAAYVTQFRFFCNFTESTDEVLFYEAHWYVNNRFIYNSPLAAYNDPANERVLTEAKLREQGVITVGFDIYCDIRAGRRANGAAGLPSTSKPIFIGIEVLTPAVTIKEGNSGRIWIRATASIGCPDAPCIYGVTANIPTGSDTCSPTVRADTACGVAIDPDNWEQIYSIKVTGTITEDGYGQHTNVMKITLRSPDRYFGHLIWGNYTLAPVTVNVIKDTKAIESRHCIVLSGGFVFTFGKSGVLLSIPETFTMYQNNDYNIEVQIKAYHCSYYGNLYCVCGIVVRVGQTVFMINHCSIDYWFIDYILCNDGGDILDVRGIDDIYRIILSTGAYFEIYINSTGSTLNVFMNPSVVDFGVSGGLCGNLTIMNYNELVLRSGSITTDDESFFDSWRSGTLQQRRNFEVKVVRLCVRQDFRNHRSSVFPASLPE
ncbi:uncharacterized protein LOC126822577 isoform X2 [Patella vulgata]|uniref:uncharacterized protein LOC126822577 isoform X2 n=1 Tax=Patella vulgata TaxID=6465 RepID=UPI0024A7EC71|nr:uncharacterized protein LOC126822577 isoform X2 [Patella vulgata]